MIGNGFAGDILFRHGFRGCSFHRNRFFGTCVIGGSWCRNGLRRCCFARFCFFGERFVFGRIVCVGTVVTGAVSAVIRNDDCILLRTDGGVFVIGALLALVIAGQQIFCLTQFRFGILAVVQLFDSIIQQAQRAQQVLIQPGVVANGDRGVKQGGFFRKDQSIPIGSIPTQSVLGEIDNTIGVDVYGFQTGL